MNNGEAYKRRVVTMDALNARNRHRKMLRRIFYGVVFSGRMHDIYGGVLRRIFPC